MGRPKGRDTVPVTIKITVEQADALARIPGKWGMNRSEAIREILDQWLQLGGPAPERGFLAGYNYAVGLVLEAAGKAAADVYDDFKEGRIPLPAVE